MKKVCNKLHILYNKHIFELDFIYCKSIKLDKIIERETFSTQIGVNWFYTYSNLRIIINEFHNYV